VCPHGRARGLAAMFTRRRSSAKHSRGQSLVETALMIPLLLLLILNAVNFGYFLLVSLNLTSATRNGIEYAIQGSSTPANGPLPAPGTLSSSNASTVEAVIAQELGAFIKNGKLTVQVCSTGSSNGAQPICKNSDTDPEFASGFALSRVDITYQFSTLIPTAPFNLVVGALPPCDSTGKCTFARHAEMRAMGS
jgi:Flp pilus assembly protein TadG